MRPTVPTSQPVSSEIVRFGVFEVDLATGALRSRGEKVNMQELPFRALKLLVSRSGEVLSKEDFRAALWAEDVFVDFDGGVLTAIKRLRDTLGDSPANPIFIETVGRRGYRWIAPVQREASVGKSSGEELAAEAASAGAEASESIEVAGTTKNANRFRRRRFALVLVVFVVLSASLYWFRFRTNPNLSVTGAHHPANHKAEELYLQGRFYWNKRTPESLNKAVDSFMQAVVQDPGYSQAYMGLADCYNLLREFSVMPAAEAYPRAFAAAKKAVELDDQLSQAHASLAFVSFFGMRDTATAEREFQRAIELDPNNGVAHHWYATYLMSLRRYPEALAEIGRAQALDPTSNSIVSDKGMILCNAGRLDEAMALFRQVEEADPNFVSPHRALAGMHLDAGDSAGYLTEARKAAVLVHDNNDLAVVDAAQQAFAVGGRRAMLLAMLHGYKKFYEQGVVSPFNVAGTYVLLEDKRNALVYLDKAYDDHTDGLVEIEGGAGFHNFLHGELAYRDLVRKIGLTPVQ